MLTLAVYPGRLLRANPLPKHFTPRVNKNRAKSFLYSEEDAKLMSCALRYLWCIVQGTG